MNRAISTVLTTTLVILGVAVAPRAGAVTPMCRGQEATIVGTGGNDVIEGTYGDDVIVGLGGDDLLRGHGGNDLICGGRGSDNVLGGSGNDILACGPGHDGGAEGGDGDDTLYGEKDGRNDLYPGLGDDLIVGSPAGPDWLHLSDAPGPIHASLIIGLATGQGTDTLVDVDVLYGGVFDDELIGNDDDNGLVGPGGDDTLIGNGGNDSLTGQQGDDIYEGGSGFDVAEYYDQAAADELEIGPMIVNLRTGIATGDGTDALSSIEGATGSDKADTMIGDRKGNAFFWLFDGFDTVRAGGGSDFVESSAGPDDLAGGAGRDMVAYLDGKDFDHQHPAVTVDLAAGTSSSGDTLRGFEDILGSPHGDTLLGDKGPNRFYGYLGDDVLSGRAGDDTLIGDEDNDEAHGGPGKDRCRAEVRRGCEAGRKALEQRRSPTLRIEGAMSWLLQDRRAGRLMDRSGAGER